MMQHNAMKVPRPAGFHRLRRGAPALLLSLGLGLAWLPQAQADMFPDNEARRAILDLRGQMAQNQQANQAQLAQQAQQIQQIRSSLLDLANQIEQLKTEIAQLRGQQDTTTRQLNDTIAKVAASQKDLTQRMAPLEPVAVQIGGKSYTVQPAEKAAYEQALAAFRSSDFAGAGSQFKAFLAQYPSSPYASEAQYWLANSLYAQKQYRDAVSAFNGLINGYPGSSRIPESMLGLANCQVELREVRAARLTLQKLVKNYPQSEAAQAAKDRLAKLR